MMGMTGEKVETVLVGLILAGTLWFVGVAMVAKIRGWFSEPSSEPSANFSKEEKAGCGKKCAGCSA